MKRADNSYNWERHPRTGAHQSEEAILVANDVKADLIIPSHWGTITLTDEPPFEPPERYQA